MRRIFSTWMFLNFFKELQGQLDDAYIATALSGEMHYLHLQSVLYIYAKDGGFFRWTRHIVWKLGGSKSRSNGLTINVLDEIKKLNKENLTKSQKEKIKEARELYQKAEADGYVEKHPSTSGEDIAIRLTPKGEDFIALSELGKKMVDDYWQAALVVITILGFAYGIGSGIFQKIVGG